MKKTNIIYSSKIKENLSITYDSDLHYMPGMNLNYLKKQIDNLESDPTTYYFLLGDLLNDSKIDLKDLQELRDVLAKISKTKTKVYAILGNHDQVTRDNQHGWKAYYNQEFANMLREIDGFNLLENESIYDDNIVIHGTRFNSHYYEKDVYEPIEEYISIMSKISAYQKETFNILLEHSPYRVFDKDYISKVPALYETDLIFSGHFHNGLIPSYISKYLKGNVGLIAYSKLFPKNTRGKKQITDNTVGFISAPITTFAPHYGSLQKLNTFYPPIEQKVLIKRK